MGRIAAKHSLNDLFAARAYPISTQMIISTPKSLNIIQKRDIYQMSEGANSILRKCLVLFLAVIHIVMKMKKAQ